LYQARARWQEGVFKSDRSIVVFNTIFFVFPVLYWKTHANQFCRDLQLDRLSRNVAFIANLLESKVDFVVVDNPHANKLMVHLLSAFAEHEREQIGIRTKEALQAAKRRGV
jgi:hypothetical protein